MKKKLMALSALLCLSMTIFAQNATFSGGTGTENDPFLISNETDLKTLVKQSMATDDYGDGLYFKQTGDIAFTPSGDENVGNFDGIAGRAKDADGNIDWESPLMKFQGHYDGEGHFISKCTIINQIGCGFINCLGEKGVLENVRFKDNYITSTYGVTGIAVAVNFGKVKNCFDYSTYYTVIGAEVGGLVGSNQNGGIIEECGNVSDVYANFGNQSYSIGGIVGNNNGGKVIACFNLGSINGKAQVGGIVGTQEGDGEISDCYNGGSVDCEGTSQMSGGAGIVGVFQQASAADPKYKPTLTINNCYNYGKVTVTNSLESVRCAGTICGIFDPRMNIGTLTRTNCYSDKEKCDITEDDVTLLSTEEMKKATDKLNNNRTPKVFANDLATPVNNGYPILAWQPDENFPEGNTSTSNMKTMFNNFDIPLGSDFNVIAIDHKRYDGKKDWAYVSADTSIVAVAGNFFVGQKIGSTTMKKIVYKRDDHSAIDSCEFTVNVVAEADYKPNCFLPCMEFGKTRAEIKAFEEARGNKVYTDEYFTLMNTSDDEIEVIKTDNPFIPIMFYFFDDNDNYCQASLEIASTYQAEAPDKMYDTFMHSQSNFTFLGLSATGTSNIYYDETAKMFAGVLMEVLIQGGNFSSMEFVYDPDKSITDEYTGINDISAEKGAISVENNMLQIKLSNGKKTMLNIYNTLGQNVYAQQVTNGASISLKPGLYIVRLGNESKKIIIHNK
jgi:hypothetical protein